MYNSKKIAALLSYIQIALNMIYSVMFTPFILRALGKSEYGIYTLCTSVISYLNLFQFGFGTTYIRYYIKYNIEKKQKKAEELNGMFLEIFAIITSMTLVVGIFLIANIKMVFGTKITPNEYTIAQVLMKLVVFQTVLSVAGVPFSALITAHEKFVFQKLLLLLETILKIVVLIPLLILGQKSVAIIGMSTILSAITFLANLIFVFNKLKVKFRFTNFDFSLFKEISVFSFFIFLQSIMDMFNWQIDRFLLARFWGASEISVYSVGAQFNSVYLSLCTAFTNLFVPKANQLVAEKQNDSKLTNLMIRIGRLQFLICTFLFSAFVFFGSPFVKFYAGEEYKNAYWVAILLMMPLIFPLSMDLWYHIARAKGKHKTSTIVFVVVAFLNLLVSIPLCKQYSEIGAALGTCIGMFVANNIFQIIYAHKVVKLDMKLWANNILYMSKALILPIVIGTMIFCFADINNVNHFIFYAIFYTCISAISFWFFALNHNEKDLIIKPFMYIYKKTFKKKEKRI